jgi:hypothetical protein
VALVEQAGSAWSLADEETAVDATTRFDTGLYDRHNALCGPDNHLR